MDVYERMKLTPKDVSMRIAHEEGMRNILKSGVAEHIAYSEARIGEIAEGCHQWLAVAFTLPENTSLLMFRGQVEQLFRLIVLDTLFYEIVCREYAGGPVRYHPVIGGDIGPSYATASQTTGLLRAAFGDGLSPELARWEYAEEKRLLVPAGYARR
jgi:hypothetical protein